MATNSDSSGVQVLYEASFRTQRGGRGIDYEVALAELLTVLEPVNLHVMRHHRPRMRVWLSVDPPEEDELSARVQLLGYTHALTRITRFAGKGTDETARVVGRVRVGDQRIGDDLLRYEPLWVADEGARRRSSPHRRPFELDLGGDIKPVRSHRAHRRLSTCDAKLLLNLTRTRPGQVLLDPYAGIGGIVIEAVARGIDVVCADLDALLRPGLHRLSAGRNMVADAAALPVRSGSVDVVVTEPSFDRHHRASVLASIGELARCLVPQGRLGILLSEDMLPQVSTEARRRGLRQEQSHILRRQKMISPLLVFVKA